MEKIRGKLFNLGRWGSVEREKRLADTAWGREKARQLFQYLIAYYRPTLERYQGDYLPDTIYDDWTSLERERLTPCP